MLRPTQFALVIIALAALPARSEPRIVLDDTAGLPAREVIIQPVLPEETLPPEAQELIQRQQKEQEVLQQRIADSRAALLDQLQALEDKYDRENKPELALAIANQIQRLQGMPTLDDLGRGNMSGFRGRIGEAFVIDVVGQNNQTVWGTDFYTDDSGIATAAVHAGIVGVGQRARVSVTMAAGRPGYEGSNRNGITTNAYGAWTASYVIEKAPEGAQLTRPGKAPPAPANLRGLRGRVGERFRFEVTGSNLGLVYGDGVYTDDSPLSAAAVHAGVLQPGQKGTVTIRILAGRDQYDGATRNGVATDPYGKWDGSYEFVKAKARDVVEP